MRSVSRCLFLLLVLSLWLVFVYVYRNKEMTPSNSSDFPTVMHDNQFCLGHNFLASQKPFPSNVSLIPITLTTHGTSETIDFIEEKAASWKGPISFALFLDFNSQLASNYITNVWRCNKEFQDKVSVHIGFRISPFQDKCQSIEIPPLQVSCEEFLKNQKALKEQIDGPFGLYPFNVMRNLARHGAQTELHFVIDADMIISDGFAEKVERIANRMIDGKKKSALVIRRFETEKPPIPRNLLQLKADFDNKTIFEFHHKFFFVGHHIPDVSGWFQNSISSEEVKTWEIPYLGVQWETPTIVHRNSEYNAEYFPPRVRDVHSMIYKLCRANYTFHLVSQVFAVHEGIKIDDTMFSKVVDAHSRKYGRMRAFRRYVKEMDERFPGTIEKCGKFHM